MKALRKLKNVLIVIGMIALVSWGYVEIVNMHSINMTTRQKILKAVYPAFVWVNKLANKNTERVSHVPVIPPVSFYSLTIVLNDGTRLDMASLKGKKVLLVNTASACGYTAQYEQLQKLYSTSASKLAVIGFPANDFQQQEKGSNEEIASFCKKNYGVAFPLAEKSIVVAAPGQNIVFQWLTNPAQNGWNSRAPSWNFSKYLVNENGILINYFGPAVEPMSEAILKAVR